MWYCTYYLSELYVVDGPRWRHGPHFMALMIERAMWGRKFVMPTGRAALLRLIDEWVAAAEPMPSYSTTHADRTE